MAADMGEIDDSNLTPAQGRAAAAAAYSGSNSRLANPELINETVERYQYLLTDPSSPLLSNFLALLDYRDGRDFMSMEDFQKDFGEIGASSPQYMQMRHPLRVCMRQTEKLKTLCEELDRMTATSIDIQVHIDQKRAELENEFAGAHKYKSWYTKKKEESLRKAISQNVTDMFKVFLDEQKTKPKIALEMDSK